jgi:methyl-accepting chemotaxis protein
MSRLTFIVLASALLALMLGGCKTPRPALDEANNGAALTVSLAGEIKNFRSAQARVAQARVDSVRRQRVLLANYEAEGNFDERVLKAADKGDALRLYTALKELSDSRALDAKQLQDKLAAMDVAFAKLLEPLPEATKDLTATQKALAVLGEELSAHERIATTAAFVKEIRKSVEENREKIKEAEKTAAGASGTAAPADQP